MPYLHLGCVSPSLTLCLCRRHHCVFGLIGGGKLDPHEDQLAIHARGAGVAHQGCVDVHRVRGCTATHSHVHGIRILTIHILIHSQDALTHAHAPANSHARTLTPLCSDASQQTGKERILVVESTANCYNVPDIFDGKVKQGVTIFDLKARPTL